jgi:hypothetical protein
MSDAIGYYVAKEFPMVDVVSSLSQFLAAPPSDTLSLRPSQLFASPKRSVVRIAP